MATSVLNVSSLKKSFNGTEVLKGIDLSMGPGDFWALMGASGSGKSTLLNIIGALIPPSGGEVLIDGNSLINLNDKDLAKLRREQIGWVFQDFLLIDNLSALENVLVPMNLGGYNGPEAESRAHELLKLVGLADRINHFPDELSGGQQQRVALARALANDPVVILADEPTGNLDTKTGLQIIDIFETLAGQGKSILMVSHDVRLAHAAQKVFILKNGVIHEELKGSEEMI